MKTNQEIGIKIKPRIKLPSLVVASMFAVGASQFAQAGPTVLYYENIAGFDSSSLTIISPGLTTTFGAPVNTLDFHAPNAPHAQAYNKLSWKFAATDTPSSLEITSYSDTQTVNRLKFDGITADVDGQWNSGDWWSITRLTQTNNVITGSGTPLWKMDAVGDLKIFSTAAHSTQISPDDGPNGLLIDHHTAFSFHETNNLAACTTNNLNGPPCEDLYSTQVDLFDPVLFTGTDGLKYQLSFQLFAVQDAFIDQNGNTLSIYTRENAPGTSIVDLKAQWAQVPEPFTLSLMGVGLLGLGIARRRRLDV